MKRSLANKWAFIGLINKDSDLKPVDKVVAWFLLNHYNLKTGRCFPSHKRLAEESNYSLRQVKYATKRLCAKYFYLKRRGHTGSANEYMPLFELIDQEKAVVQYNNKIRATSEQEMVQHTAPQNIKENINKTDVTSDDFLIWKIEKNMLGRLDQVQLDRGRRLIAKREKLRGS